MNMSNLIPQEYKSTLDALVLRVKQAQYNVLKAFSSEKVMMAWDLGKIISEKATNANWGSKVVENLSKDLQVEFAGVGGFSFREIKYMRQFYETYCNNTIGHPLVAQISWSNNKIILDKCKDTLEAEFYIKKSISNGWSKYDLTDQIKRGLYQNSLLAQNNFERTLEVGEDLKQRVTFDFRDDMGIELINDENPFAEKDIEENSPLEGWQSQTDGVFGIPTKAKYSKHQNLPYNPKLKENAKEHRKAGVLSEVLFWNKIKNKQLLGLDFERQKIIGNYIVDFFCPELGIVVEIDGESHNFKGEYDVKREEYLIGHGLEVLHYSDIEIKKAMDIVMGNLYNHLKSKKEHPVSFAATPHEGNNQIKPITTN